MIFDIGLSHFDALMYLEHNRNIPSREIMTHVPSVHGKASMEAVLAKLKRLHLISTPNDVLYSIAPLGRVLIGKEKPNKALSDILSAKGVVWPVKRIDLDPHSNFPLVDEEQAKTKKPVYTPAKVKQHKPQKSSTIGSLITASPWQDKTHEKIEIEESPGIALALSETVGELDAKLTELSVVSPVYLKSGGDELSDAKEHFSEVTSLTKADTDTATEASSTPIDEKQNVEVVAGVEILNKSTEDIAESKDLEIATVIPLATEEDEFSEEPLTDNAEKIGVVNKKDVKLDRTEHTFAKESIGENKPTVTLAGKPTTEDKLVIVIPNMIELDLRDAECIVVGYLHNNGATQKDRLLGELKRLNKPLTTIGFVEMMNDLDKKDLVKNQLTDGSYLLRDGANIELGFEKGQRALPNDKAFAFSPDERLLMLLLSRNKYISLLMAKKAFESKGSTYKNEKIVGILNGLVARGLTSLSGNGMYCLKSLAKALLGLRKMTEKLMSQATAEGTGDVAKELYPDVTGAPKTTAPLADGHKKTKEVSSLSETKGDNKETVEETAETTVKDVMEPTAEIITETTVELDVGAVHGEGMISQALEEIEQVGAVMKQWASPGVKDYDEKMQVLSELANAFPNQLGLTQYLVDIAADLKRLELLSKK